MYDSSYIDLQHLQDENPSTGHQSEPLICFLEINSNVLSKIACANDKMKNIIFQSNDPCGNSWISVLVF